jgi:pyruvate dehydrogenase E1 component beta subunit
LTVVFPSQRHHPGETLRRATLDWLFPTVFLEHKLLYNRSVDSAGYREFPAHPDDPAAHLFPVMVRGSGSPDVTLVCFGDAVALAEAAAERLAEEEISVEIVVPSLLNPFPHHTLSRALAHRYRIVAIEEAPGGGGFGAELAGMLLASGFQGQFARVAPPPVPIPAARSLEAHILPDMDNVIAAVTALLLNEPQTPPQPEL